jgi:hypothetical protein
MRFAGEVEIARRVEDVQFLAYPHVTQQRSFCGNLVLLFADLIKLERY